MMSTGLGLTSEPPVRICGLQLRAFVDGGTPQRATLAHEECVTRASANRAHRLLASSRCRPQRAPPGHTAVSDLSCGPSPHRSRAAPRCVRRRRQPRGRRCLGIRPLNGAIFAGYWRHRQRRFRLTDETSGAIRSDIHGVIVSGRDARAHVARGGEELGAPQHGGPALAASARLWKPEFAGVAHGDGHRACDEVAQARRRGFDARQVGGTQLREHVVGKHVVGQVEETCGTPLARAADDGAGGADDDAAASHAGGGAAGAPSKMSSASDSASIPCGRAARVGDPPF